MQSRNELYNKVHSKIQLDNTIIEIKKNSIVIGILDISGSMTSVLYTSKTQAAKLIGKQNLYEFDGCFFSGNFLDNSLTKLINYKINENKDVGAIYIFADFQDYIHPNIFSILFPLLHEKNIRLYLNSLELTPGQELIRIAKSTGGNFSISKLK